MARTLSQDLRGRVVAAIDGGLSRHAAAARLNVSVSSAIRWRRFALEHGRAVASDAAATGIRVRSKRTATSSGN